MGAVSKSLSRLDGAEPAEAAASGYLGIRWNDDTLDKWPSEPQKLVPGSKMFFQDRADVTEYLKERAT